LVSGNKFKPMELDPEVEAAIEIFQEIQNYS
jgi:hypothetical protein